MSRNSHPVALVTGASRGIGAVVARRLAKDGFAIAVNYAASASEAESLATELRNSGVPVCAVQGDVSKSDEVRRMFETVEQLLGKIDVLVNNAGVLKTLPLAQTSDEQFEHCFSINVQGVFNTLREAASRMNDGGRIINLSSTTLALNLPGYAVYNGSKAAVEAITRVFAKELRGRQITVNAVAPGPVATDLFMNGKTEEQIQTFTKMSPLERLGQPSDIAGVIAFLAGPDGAWVNGQVLRTNGGIA